MSIILAPDWRDFQNEGGALTPLELLFTARKFPELQVADSNPAGNLGGTYEDDVIANRVLDFVAELRKAAVSVAVKNDWCQTCWRESVQHGRGMEDAAEWTQLRKQSWLSFWLPQQYALCLAGLADADGNPTEQAIYAGRRY